MPFKKMRKIDDLLSVDHRRHTPLAKLLRSASDQQHLTAAVRALLPETLARGVSGARLRGTSLTLVCDSGALATRLRFQSSTLLKDLVQLEDFAAVRDIRLRVLPNS